MIEVYFKKDDSVYKYQDTSKRRVHDFMKVLNGKREKRICQTDGEIRFYSKDSLLFVGGFSISGGVNECKFLMRGDDAWRLTYNAGMFLDYAISQKSKKNESDY